MKFTLKAKQKIEFGKLAIKKLKELYPGGGNYIPLLPYEMIPLEDIITDDAISFAQEDYSGFHDHFVTFLFNNNGLSCYFKFCGKNFSKEFRQCLDKEIQLLYYDYMYKIFGERFRIEVLKFLEGQSAEIYKQYKERREETIAKLDEEEKEILADTNTFLDFVSNLGTTNDLKND